VCSDRARDGVAVLIPGPRLSRKLSEFICLPHIVQVCLTHDPSLLERVATLLCQIMEVSIIYTSCTRILKNLALELIEVSSLFYARPS
jgi:hypothetical protein